MLFLLGAIFLGKTAESIQEETGGVIYRKLLYDLEGGKKGFMTLDVAKFATLLKVLDWRISDFERETGLEIPEPLSSNTSTSSEKSENRLLDLPIYNLKSHWPFRNEDLITDVNIISALPFEPVKHAKGWPIHIMYATNTIDMEPVIKQGAFVLFIEEPIDKPLDWRALYFIEDKGKIVLCSLITHPTEVSSDGAYKFVDKFDGRTIDVVRNKVLGSAIPWN